MYAPNVHIIPQTAKDAQRGEAFWLEYTDGDVCEIYDCCVNIRGQAHCGRCRELPCKRYVGGDPTKTAEENAGDLRRQMRRLKEMAEQGGCQ